MLHLLAHLNVLYQTSQDAIPQFFHNCTVLPGQYTGMQTHVQTLS